MDMITMYLVYLQRLIDCITPEENVIKLYTFSLCDHICSTQKPGPVIQG